MLQWERPALGVQQSGSHVADCVMLVSAEPPSPASQQCSARRGECEDIDGEGVGVVAADNDLDDIPAEESLAGQERERLDSGRFKCRLSGDAGLSGLERVARNEFIEAGKHHVRTARRPGAQTNFPQTRARQAIRLQLARINVPDLARSSRWLRGRLNLPRRATLVASAAYVRPCRTASL